MVTKFKIHFQSIDGYVNLNKKFKDKIKQKILAKLPVYKFAKKVDITCVHIGHFLNRKESFININFLIQIARKLKIPLSSVEKNIIAFRDANSRAYDIKFPYYFTPVDMRIIGVLVGDGNIHKELGMLRWIQKDIRPLERVISKRIRYKLSSKNKTQIVIPSFFRKVACYALNLKVNELGTYKIVKQNLDLSKHYKLALLIAIIEDEGNIDPKNYSSISIRLSDKRLIYHLKRICDSLSYETPKIVKYLNRGNYGQNIMYKLSIPSNGIFKLGHDILNFERKFGRDISLWKKRKNFFERWDICTNKKARKDRDGRRIHKGVMVLLKRHPELSIDEMANKIKTSHERIGWLIKNMYKRGEVERVRRGIYTIKII